MRYFVCIVVLVLLLCRQLGADSFTDFEAAGFAPGESVHNHAPDGTAPAGISNVNNCVQAFRVGNSGPTTEDEEIVDLGAPWGKVWRVSQGTGLRNLGAGPQAPNTGDVHGELNPPGGQTVHNDAGCGVPTTASYYAEFDFKSVTEAPVAMSLSVQASSADQRHGFVRFLDDGAGSGLDLQFFDTIGTTFNGTILDLDVSYDEWHRLGIEIFFVDGLASGSYGTTSTVGNDVVNIYLDNVLVHTGTSWESFYASATDPTRQIESVDRLLILGAEIAAQLGGGLYFDSIFITQTCPDGHCLAEEPPCELVSEGKPVRASGVERPLDKAPTVITSRFYPEHGNDGNFASRWSSPGAPMVNKCFGGVPPRNIGEGQWLEIDLEGYYRICGIEAYWERARSDEYTIDISADRCNWTTIVDFSRPPAEVAALGNSGQPIDVFLPGDFLPDGDYCARFVRWHSKEDPINANGFLNYSLFEFQVYGQDNCGTPPIEPPVNILAAQPPVLVQINRDPTGSDPGGPLPDKAPFSPEIFVAGGSVIADGDTANYPVSANLYELRHLAASPPAVDPDHGVITITLAEKTWIDKAVILWDTRSLPSRFVVRTSCEGSPFELAGRVNATANWNVENGDGLWDVIEFDEKVVADKVRIVLQERCNLYSAEIGMGIREVELFCTEPTVDPAICAVP